MDTSREAPAPPPESSEEKVETRGRGERYGGYGGVGEGRGLLDLNLRA